MRVGIDASNILAGGGLTHLTECLTACEPQQHSIEKVVVFGAGDTLAHIPTRSWIEKHSSPLLNGGYIERLWWQRTQFRTDTKSAIDILLVPGGTYLGSFRPFVAMAQNLLPFDVQERRRGGLRKQVRLILLERMQTATFARATGVIYMTETSRRLIEQKMGFHAKRSRVVYHGSQPRFFRTPKQQQPAEAYSQGNPFRLLYVSILEPYKHQDMVVDAVAILRGEGIPISLDLVGPGARRYQGQIEAQIKRHDPTGEFLRYRGQVPYEALDRLYAEANAFVFASSCETFGIILLEAMAAGLPLLCSNRSAMPEVVSTAAEYFDPFERESLLVAIRRLWGDSRLRHSLAVRGQARAHQFSWARCASETFGFVNETLQNSKDLPSAV
jgi:glycosyltransferase involved in cell wall biosynthesis